MSLRKEKSGTSHKELESRKPNGWGSFHDWDCLGPSQFVWPYTLCRVLNCLALSSRASL